MRFKEAESAISLSEVYIHQSRLAVSPEDEEYEKRFKNDLIFKIKSTDAYIAPPELTEFLSFRKGQAF